MNREDPYLPELKSPRVWSRDRRGTVRSSPTHRAAELATWCRNASLGINAALLARRTTGRGRHVETSLLQSWAFSGHRVEVAAAEDSDSAGLLRHLGLRPRGTKGMFQCADDRWVRALGAEPAVVLSSAEDGRHAHSCDVNVDRVRDDPDRVPDRPEEHRRPRALLPRDGRGLRRSRATIGCAWPPTGVPLQPVRTPEEALGDPRARRRGRGTDVPTPSTAPFARPESSTASASTPGTRAGPVPSVGEHTDVDPSGGDAARLPAAPECPQRTRPRRSTGSRCSTSVSPSPVRSAPRSRGPRRERDQGQRVAGPHWWHADHIVYGANHGKRSVGIDLKTPEGLAVLHRLVERADVVHSNMRRTRSTRLRVATRLRSRAVTPTSSLPYLWLRPRAAAATRPATTRTGAPSPGNVRGRRLPRRRRPFWSLTSSATPATDSSR